MYAERLKELREKKGYTQIQAGKIVNVSGPSYAAYESGKSKPPIDTLATFAGHYGVSLDWLVGLSNDEGKYQMNTYADVISAIRELFEAVIIDIEKVPVGFDDDPETRPRYALEIEDPMIQLFLSGLVKMLELRNSKTIDDDLFDLWYQNQIDGANTYTIKKMPEDTKLPF